MLQPEESPSSARSQLAAAGVGALQALRRIAAGHAGRDYLEFDEQRTCNLEGEDVLIASLTDILGLR
jgi:hypothetical protein